MAKHDKDVKSTGRPTKKPRVEKSSQPSAKQVNGSHLVTIKTKSQRSNAPSPSISARKKGKGKESTDLTSSITKSKKIAVEDDSPPVLPSSFKIVAGSYEKLLYGLEGTVTLDDDSNPVYHLKPTFIFPAHVSCIKAVAASPNGGKWLATGSADEIVKVWDLRRKKEIGGLMHHEGSITHLIFPSRSHLLSASEDGTLCLFRARDWSVLRALRGHKGRVNSVAVHPSGKVALSVGKDKTLRMWDLMRGKGCASTKLGKEGELVRWSTDGSLFIVQAGSTIDVYTTDMVLLQTITHPSRLHDVRFCKRVRGEGDVLLAGAEDKKLSIYDISTDPEKIPRIVAVMTGHSNRVKAVQALDIALPPSASERTSTTIVCTVSSDGYINLYDLAALPEVLTSQKVEEINPVATYDSKGTRLTCVTLADGVEGAPPINGKRKRDDTHEADEKEDEDEAEELEGEEAGWEDEQEEDEEEEIEGEEEAEQESD